MPDLSRAGASALAALALASATAGSAAAQNWSVPKDGYELLRHLQRETADTSTMDGLRTYSNGIAARAFVIGAFLNGTANGLYCMRKDTSILWDDVVVVARAYLEQNTNLLGDSPGVLISLALEKAFPC